MMQALNVLNILREKNRNHPMWINRGLYRQLYNPTLHILAYERLKSKPGNVRHIRKRGEKVKGFNLYLAAINRKQIPVCHQCHRDIHNGKYDGNSLAEITDRLQTPNTATEGSSS